MRRAFNIPYILIPVIIFSASSFSTEVHAQSATPLKLTFGLYQSSKATVMQRTFTPVIDAIQEDMQERLKRPVEINIRILRSYEKANRAFVSGGVDFVRFGPSSYVIAKSRNPEIQLLAMEAKNGKKRFDGIIAVHRNSDITSLKDLAGKRFAFGDRNSTIGRYLAQAELLDAGVHGSDLAGYDYLGRHDKVAMAVSAGDYDAGSLKESTFDKFRVSGKLRAIHRFENVTQPWIARAGLPQDVFDALQSALLALDDPEVIHDLKVSGFLPTSDREYDMVRTCMEAALKFTGENRQE